MISKRVVLVVPGRLDSRTGGYEYDRRIAAGLQERGWLVDVRELSGRFPEPTAADVDGARLAFSAIPDGTAVLVDGLAYGAIPQAVEHEATRLRFVPIVHMRLASAIGLDQSTVERLGASETRALKGARAIIVTGSPTADALVRAALEAPIVVVEPGTDPAPLAHGSNSDAVHMLCVATVNAGKGHGLLIDSLARLRHLSWQLTCAGSLDRDPGTVETVRERLSRAQLDGRVRLVGEQDRAALDALYARADLFVLPTLSETFGMAVAEAIAHGLPVVSTTTGAIPRLVGRDAGLLVRPGDVEALTIALSQVLQDGALRCRLTEGAREARSRLRPWSTAVDGIERVLADLP